MKKNIVKLTESELKQIITESVKKIISEMDWKTYANAARKSSFNDLNRYSKFSNKASDEFNKKYNYSNSYSPKDNIGITSTNIDGINPDDVLKTNNPDNPYETWTYGDIPIEYYERYSNEPEHEWDEEYVDDNGNIKTSHRKIDNGEWKTYRPIRRTNGNNIDNKNLQNLPDYKKLKQKYTDANDEFENYLNGNYKYIKGKGWTLNK